MALAAQSTAVIAGTYTPEADFIPYEAGSALWLEVRLRDGNPVGLRTGTTTPFLLPGGSLTLPLLEYSDIADATGFVVPEEVVEIQEDAFEPEIEEEKDTPAPALLWLVLGLALVAARRR